MNTGKMKNIVVLRELPSNIVEEAIVFLKDNEKGRKAFKTNMVKLDDRLEEKKQGKINTLENENSINTSSNKKESTKKQDEKKDYIIKEAQMLIAEYISKIEENNKKEDLGMKKMKLKYKRLRAISYCLTIALVCSLIMNVI